MYIYYCDKCQSFESFVGAEEEWKCKGCGSELIPLGVTIDEWNAMTNDQMLDTIDFAKAEFDKKNSKYDYPEVMDEPKQPKPDVRVDLMECPECFKSISPKSMRCPYCEHYFVNNPKAVRRRKAKRKTSIKVLLIGLLPAIIGAVYEGIILSGEVLEGELTLLQATGSSLLYPVLYGGFVLVLAGLIMIITGIIGIATNKPYLPEKIREDDWEEGVIVSGVVTHDGSESNDAYKDVIRPEKKKKAPKAGDVNDKAETKAPKAKTEKKTVAEEVTDTEESLESAIDESTQEANAESDNSECTKEIAGSEEADSENGAAKSESVEADNSGSDNSEGDNTEIDNAVEDDSANLAAVSETETEEAVQEEAVQEETMQEEDNKQEQKDND